LEGSTPPKDSWVRILGKYYSYTLSGSQNVKDVILASNLEKLNGSSDIKKIPVKGAFMLVSGKIADIKSVTYNDKKAVYFILESESKTAYPVFSETGLGYKVGDIVKVAGKFEYTQTFLTNAPDLKHAHPFPSQWPESKIPLYILSDHFSEKIK